MNRWQKRLQSYVKDINGDRIVAVEDGYFNQSIPTTVVGNAITEILPPCDAGQCRLIKAITITGDGNSGTAKLKIGATVVLPIYFSVMNNAMTSTSVRLRVDAGESVTVITEGRDVANETFIGVTYYNMEV